MPTEEGHEVVNTEVVQDATATESTAVETESSEDNQTPQHKVVIADNGEIQRVPVEASSDDEEDGNGDKAEEEKPKRGAEARKEQLRRETEAAHEESARIREMVAEKNQAIAEQQRLQAQLDEINRANAEAENVPSVEYIMQQENPETGDFYTEYEARMVHENLKLQYQLDQQQQMAERQAYESRIAESVDGLAADIERTLSEFPEFDSSSEQYNPGLAAEAERIMMDALIYEPTTGRLIGSNVPVYQLYKTLHEAAQGSIEARKATQQAQRQQELAQADVRGSGKRLQKEFSKLSAKEMEAELRRKGHDI